MKAIILALAIIGVVSGAALYDAVKSMTGYGQKAYKENCYETKYKEQCESYEEKVCYTIQKEHCTNVLGKKCRAIQTIQQERVCFDVQEMVCSLKEAIQFYEVPAIITVQRCHNLPERVCDTVYEAEHTTKDDFKCIAVINPKCKMVEHTVYDQTCRHVTNFDCKPDVYGPTAYGSDGPKAHGDYSVDSDYGHEVAPTTNYKCARSQEIKCYNSPRTVTAEHCVDVSQEVCEKLTERVPVPREQQSCHNEMKKVCELEERTQPKQVKKYVYTNDCRPVHKQICENADQKFLTPSCAPYSRKKCTYQPEEKCDKIPKNYCYKVPYQVKKKECEPKPYEPQDYEPKDNFFPKAPM